MTRFNFASIVVRFKLHAIVLMPTIVLKGFILN